MNKHERMMQQIEKHGEDLKRIFNLTDDPIKICKKLKSLELKANRAATCLCNTNTLDRLELTRQEEQVGNVKQATEDEQDAFFNAILVKVNKILNFKAQNIPVFINHDPRGYALKIKSEYVKDLQIYKDWGGYGILAPEFDGNN
ncbi:MAG: hypothetical protein ABFD76_00390 [Smithella sp.]